MKVDASRLSLLFEDLTRAADQGQHRESLRLADSARRYAPDHPTARLIYARSLLQHGDPHAAAEFLKNQDDPDSLLLYAEAALDAGMVGEAEATCRRLLTRHAVDSLPALTGLAGRVCRTDPERYPGWMGIDSNFRLVGELMASPSATVEWGDSSLGNIAGGPMPTAFSMGLPDGVTGRIRAEANGVALLGSDLDWPMDFGLAGWVVLEDRQLTGEVSIAWDVLSPITVIVAPGPAETRYSVDPAPLDVVGRPFSWRLDDLTLDHSPLQVVVVMPDGTPAPLLGSPIKQPQLLPRPIRAVPSWVTTPSRAQTAPPLINIVIPVYGGLDETLTCIRSVLSTWPARLATITVVDDASPDAELRAALHGMAASRRITIVRNPVNLGFPGAANRGIRLHPERDVVLLNADTEVFPGWLERLSAAAYRDDGIGTVTPLGESASIVSFGNQTGLSLTSAEAARVDRIAQGVNADKAVDIPVGVGFCLYIRRKCLDEVGELDEQSFSKGYGEENDFCLRARRLGWRHVAATNVFVRHVGGRSFGAAKTALMTRNARVLNFRHPGYDDLIADFIARNPLRIDKRDIDAHQLLEGADRPVLLVTLALAGGVKRHVDERRRELEAQGATVLILRAESPDVKEPPQIRIESLNLAHLLYDRAAELDELRSLLSAVALTEIEIHHFLGLNGPVLDMLWSLGAPYRVFVHDYTWVCPRVSFLNGDGLYCGEPAVDVCESCVKQNGSALGEALTVADLRARSGRILRGAESVVAPTEDVRARLARYFPLLPIEVVPLEPPVTPVRTPRARREGPNRILLLGALSSQKGSAVLLACAKDAAARDLPLEFIVIGYAGQDPALLDTGRIFMTGPYEEHEVGALLEREDCDVALFPTVGPETWCYTLTYAMARDMPIVAFDLGSVAERLRTAGIGVLLPLGTNAADLNDELLKVAAQRRDEDEKPPQESAESGEMGSTSVNQIEEALLEPSSTVQVLNLPIGLYAFTVQSGSATATGGLLLPALQVSPAPVRGMGQIDFLSGPSTLDRWLTAIGDVVTVRISGGDASLLLTSVRGPDSGVLSIDVKRLDAPASDAEAAPEAQPAPTSDTRVITMVHVPYLGDLTFVEGWAGKPSENLWIEGFSVVVEEPSLPELVEYCSVSEEGDVSEWMSGGDLCGARGTGVPLVAFAVRIKPDAMPQYTCQYSGRFLSGNVIGPFDDGRFCRSESPGDPLVAMELRIEPDKSGHMAMPA